MLFRILMPNGQFAMGGDNFPMHSNKEGKVWRMASHLKLHLNQFFSIHGRNRMSVEEVYKNATVVEYEMVEVRRVPVKDWVKEHEDKNGVRK